MGITRAHRAARRERDDARRELARAVDKLMLLRDASAELVNAWNRGENMTPAANRIATLLPLVHAYVQSYLRR